VKIAELQSSVQAVKTVADTSASASIISETKLNMAIKKVMPECMFSFRSNPLLLVDSSFFEIVFRVAAFLGGTFRPM
jgi:hypothetical protein